MLPRAIFARRYAVLLNIFQERVERRFQLIRRLVRTNSDLALQPRDPGRP